MLRVFLALLLTLPLSAQERPHVLWLTAEDMSPWIGCYGDSTVPTPNLDRLAAEGVRYSNAFASSPVCAPARSSLITGLYATRMGTCHMRTGNPSRTALATNPKAYDQIPSYEGVPPEWARCFPELLRQAGYYCVNNSKTDYQFRAPATVWDESSGKAHWRNRAAGQPFFAVFNHTGTHESKAFPNSKRSGPAVEAQDVPLPPLYPDTPAVRDALVRTYNNIAAMDAWVGERLAELEAAGLADSTVVLFFSDHGVGLPRGKRSPYDLGTRVPLLVRDPRAEARGTVEERVVTFVDFGPTVLSLAGLEPDPRLDGRPFLGPFARAGTGLAFTHADRFDAVYDRARAVSDGRFRYIKNHLTDAPHLVPNAYRERLSMMVDLLALKGEPGLPHGLWQTTSTSRPAEELYDSQTDPWELHNLADDPEHQATLERLRGELEHWCEATGDLGLILPEAEMVHSHLWPEGQQPVTAKPRLLPSPEGWRIESDTPGASLGYRVREEGPWTPYTGPFQAPGADSLQVLAHRIGFRPARVSLPLK